MKFAILILYTQLNVYNANEPAFLLWNDLHTQQGFAWHNGTVSFGFPDDGESYIEVKIVDEYPPIEQDTLRVIRVPFEVRQKAYVATVTEDYELNIEKGVYSLEFRLLSGSKSPDKTNEYDYFVQLFFKKSDDNDFSIIRKSGEMISDKVLTIEAEPVLVN